MKTGFPLTEKKQLATDFAHAIYIGVYDHALNELQIVENTNATDFFQFLVQQQLKMVVSPTYSFLSLRVFKENNILPLKAIGYSIAENLAFLKQDMLTKYDTQEGQTYGECNSNCSSCKSSTCS